MIEQFQGEYRWLSNFAVCYVTLDGITYPSVEHAYMSAKSDDPDWKEFCRTEPNAGKVKRGSKNINLVPDWEMRKLQVMQMMLEQKFHTYPFNRKLLATGEEHIQEGNTWGDVFWGVDLRTGQGRNYLGKIIMDIRSVLQLKKKHAKSIGGCACSETCKGDCDLCP